MYVVSKLPISINSNPEKTTHTGSDDLRSSLIRIFLEILHEQASKFPNLLLKVCFPIHPGFLWVEELARNTGGGFGDVQIEDVVDFIFTRRRGELTRVDGVEDGASIFQSVCGCGSVERVNRNGKNLFTLTDNVCRLWCNWLPPSRY